MKDQSFLTFGNLLDAGMEENIFGSGCEPVGDALLRLVKVWQPLQVSSNFQFPMYTLFTTFTCSTILLASSRLPAAVSQSVFTCS